MNDFRVVFLDGGPLPEEFRAARARAFIPAVKRMLAMEEQERQEQASGRPGGVRTQPSPGRLVPNPCTESAGVLDSG